MRTPANMTNILLEFLSVQLDLAKEQLWRDKVQIPLRPKTFAVLRYLIEHSGRLVSRDEIVRAVWGETKVSEGVLRGCLHEIRQALDDSADAPRVIETVPRRGWRFIAPLTAASTQRGAKSWERKADVSSRVAL